MLMGQGFTKHLPLFEGIQSNTLLNTTIVEQLYNNNYIIRITNFFASLAVFYLFYDNTPLTLLLLWFISFNMLLLANCALAFAYQKINFKFHRESWELALSTYLIMSALLWGMIVMLNPDNSIQQHVALGILLIISGAYSMGSVFGLYTVFFPLSLMFLPITIQCFWIGDYLHVLEGLFIILYCLFLLETNRRYTAVFKKSINVKMETLFLTHQAYHDLLTKLPNQRLLLKQIEQGIHLAKLAHQNCVVICFSIDSLELFNKELGYRAGDLITQILARRFEALLTQAKHFKVNNYNYSIAMPRSDAFIILLEPIALQAISDEVSQLFSVLEHPFPLEKNKVKLSASVGVSIYPRDGTNPHVLLRNANMAMYKAKQSPGNQIEYYVPESKTKAPWTPELEHDLYHAIERNEILIFYQPIIDLKTMKIIGMEALVRWKHPILGLLHPADFINLATDTDLIIPISEWVMKEACAQTVNWNQQGHNISLRVSVNLSIKQLQKGNLIQTIDDILDKTKIDPHLIDLELTETEVLDQKIAPFIKELNKRGITLSIDEFGTGYSNLEYLKTFQISKIKIDRSLIQDITQNKGSATLVSIILEIAKESDIKTLAVGVESPEQLEFLKTRQCDYAQGYYFSKPIAMDEFTKLLKNMSSAENF